MFFLVVLVITDNMNTRGKDFPTDTENCGESPTSLFDVRVEICGKEFLVFPTNA